MNSFSDYLSHGNAWLYIPAAIVLGALHGLEPGHSKTMMAAFIVAIRGTVAQAVLLGVAATISHTALIWVLALVGMHYAGKINAESAEPYLQVATGVIVIAMAAWMLWRVWRSQRPAAHGPHGGPVLKTKDGLIEVSVFEKGVPPRFRIYFFDEGRLPMAPPADAELVAETVRGRAQNATRQAFRFKRQDAFLEAEDELPEPHEFELNLHVRTPRANESYRTQFVEEHHEHGHGHDHPHDHDHEREHGHSHEFESQDEHERAHARQWQERFANRDVTTGQLILFGITGGLLPCPSAFAVLLLCLQLKRVVLGFALVLAFSLGLAITLVTVGSLAALSVRHATKRFSGMHKLAAKMPYASACLMTVIGVIVTWQGFRGLNGLHH